MIIEPADALDVAWGFRQEGLSYAAAAWWLEHFETGIEFGCDLTGGTQKLVQPAIDGELYVSGRPGKTPTMLTLLPDSQQAAVNLVLSAAVVLDKTVTPAVCYVYPGGTPPSPLPDGTQIVDQSGELTVTVTGDVAMVTVADPPQAITTNLQNALPANVLSSVQVQGACVDLGSGSIAVTGLPAPTQANLQTGMGLWISSLPELTDFGLCYFASTDKPLAVDFLSRSLVPHFLGCCVLPAGTTNQSQPVSASLLVGGMTWNVLPDPLSACVADAGQLFSLALAAGTTSPWPATLPAGVLAVSTRTLSFILSVSLPVPQLSATAAMALEPYDDSGELWSLQQTTWPALGNPLAWTEPLNTGGYYINYTPGPYNNDDWGWVSDANFNDTISCQFFWVPVANELKLRLSFSHVIEAISPSEQEHFIEVGTKSTASWSVDLGVTTNDVNSTAQIVLTASSAPASFSFSPDITAGNTHAANAISGLATAVEQGLTGFLGAATSIVIPCIPIIGDLASTISLPVVDGQYALNAAVNIQNVSLPQS